LKYVTPTLYGELRAPMLTVLCASAIVQKKELETPAMENWITEGIVVKVRGSAILATSSRRRSGPVLC
jgi:hypothetical protein